jgi:4-hydroxyphenylacetate 3-monooxygenase
VTFLVGLAHKITEAIGTTNMPQVRELLGSLAANAGMVDGMLSGMEASGTHLGDFYLPNRHQLYAAQVLTQELYPRLIHLIRDLAGGSLIMLPSSFHDWANPELAPILHASHRSPNFKSEDKVKLLKAAWDAIGSEFGSRHTQYEMFYAGARYVAAAHSYRTFDWAAARGMVDDLLSTDNPE